MFHKSIKKANNIKYIYDNPNQENIKKHPEKIKDYKIYQFRYRRKTDYFVRKRKI